MGLKGVGGGARWLAGPQQVHNPVGRHELIRVQEQEREEPALARSAELDRLSIAGYRKCAEYPEFREPTPSPPRSRRLRGDASLLQASCQRPVSAVSAEGRKLGGQRRWEAIT